LNDEGHNGCMSSKLAKGVGLNGLVHALLKVEVYEHRPIILTRLSCNHSA